MKNKLILFVLIANFISSCYTPAYLPSSNKIDVNQYGSYITITPTKGEGFSGELLAIDSNRLIVLLESDTGSPNKSVFIQLNKVSQFTLLYAKSKNFGWSIPLFTLATIGHGAWLIFTAPVNLIVTISVASTNNFKYSEKEMTFDKLKMFARFPQGIPPTIDINSIK